ncbi:hypothetical protein UF75_0862 [Desulfosporosinus sp. I2]|nr:hypothetical protein UF75_0862 [Desulfosporosinus sp. I2]
MGRHLEESSFLQGVGTLFRPNNSFTNDFHFTSEEELETEIQALKRVAEELG